MYQYTLDDMTLQQHINTLPGRTAFIDECGSFGFDFSTEGASKLYVICAIVVKNSEISKLHQDFLNVKRNNGFANTEMKSSKVGSEYKRRSRIMHRIYKK